MCGHRFVTPFRGGGRRKWAAGSGRNWMLIGMLVVLTCAAVGRSTCPDHNDIQPCTCMVKKNGLDVTCEATDSEHVKKAMSIFKQKKGTIFSLKIRQCRMPKLPDFIFLGLDIRHLIVMDSDLAILEASSLSPLATRLTNLDLSQNKIKDVPSQALHVLQELTFLNINNNNLTILKDRGFTGMGLMERLSLYSNQIKKIEDNAFHGLERSLTRLNLGKNMLSSIPTQAFSTLANLDKLEIPENNINTIKEGDFRGLGKLDSLNLIHNQISDLGPRIFSELSNLNSLEIEHNRISHVDDEAFVGLQDRLEWLKLGNNHIHSIPSAALRRLHRLRLLDLRSNNISYFEEDSFQGFGETLKFLWLQKNRIKTIPSLALTDLHSMESLYLFSNDLNHLSRDVMEPVLDTLKVLDLHDNPLVCDCELRWYEEWLERQDSDEDRTILRETNCWFPEERHEYLLRRLPVDKMRCASMPRTAETAGSNPVLTGSVNHGIFVLVLIAAEIGLN